jgi:hypothetical protein
MASNRVEGIQRTALPQQVEEPEMMNLGSEENWRPQMNLETPPERPGWKYGWIRTSIRGEDDTLNYHKALRDGWKPVSPESVSEWLPPTIKHGNHAGFVGVQGTILMEIPIARWQQREAYYQSRNDAMRSSVDNDINAVESPSVPFTKHRTMLTSKGITPTLQD